VQGNSTATELGTRSDFDLALDLTLPGAVGAGDGTGPVGFAGSADPRGPAESGSAGDIADLPAGSAVEVAVTAAAYPDIVFGPDLALATDIPVTAQTAGYSASTAAHQQVH
jgi:hypothetical protein